MVKITAVYCVVGFIVVQILFLAVWCRPIQQYWAVPVQNCMFQFDGKLSDCARS